MHKKGDLVSDEVRTNLYGKIGSILFFIDGFDEFFAELNNHLVKSIDIFEQNIFASKTNELIDCIITNESQYKSPIITRDIKTLKSKKENNNLAKLIQELNSAEPTQLTNHELETLLHLDLLLRNNSYLNP